MAKTYGSVIVCAECSHKRLAKERITHGMTHSILYRRWADMIQRCSKTRPESQKANYLDRGISVCEGWRKFEPFRDWALTNGFDTRLQLDRTDNNKGYSPENCRWVTRRQNMRNLRKTVWIEVDGEEMPLPRAAERFGLKYATLYARICQYCWPIHRALNEPIQEHIHGDSISTRP